MMKDKKALAIRPGPRLRSIFGIFVTILFSSAILLLEPDIIGDPTDQVTFGAFDRFFSNLLYPDSEVVKNAATVVIFNQESLNDLHETWPVSFGLHAAILERIIAAHPAAVVIDFLMVDKRSDESLESLIDILKYAKNELHIPVFVTKGSEKIYKDKSVIPELAPFVIKVAGWQNVSLDRNAFRYELRVKDGEHKVSSAALAAFNIYCKRNKSLKTCQTFNFENPPEREMWVFWSSRIPDNHNVFGLSEKEKDLIFKCKNNFSSYSRFYKALNLISLLPPKNSCPPQVSIPVNFLLNDFDDRINNGLRDRIVFYGNNLEGLQDTVKPPTTLNAIAGVYMHVMAFENLVQWGRRYLSLEPAYEGLSFLNVDLIQIITLSFILILHFAVLAMLAPRLEKLVTKNRRETYETTETENFFILISENIFFFFCNRQTVSKFSKLVIISVSLFLMEMMIAAAILFIVSIFLEMMVLRLAPINWLSIFAIIAFVEPASFFALIARKRKFSQTEWLRGPP